MKTTISFVIPIFNSGYLLADCLTSIRTQNYPQKNVEIIVPDGGSQDDGPRIARKFGAKVIKNKKILAEPGFMLGAKVAKGGLIVYMGADNRLVEKTWIEKMIKPFTDPKIIAAFPPLKNNPKNTWYTKYFNAFTDPVNHFVLGSACNPLYFYHVYNVLKKTKDYIVYDFSLANFPMLAFDQGFTVRKGYKRPIDTEYDDILPVLDMLEKHMQIAYVPSVSNYHYTLEKGFFQMSKKMRWIVDNNISGQPQFGFPTRKKNLSLERKIRFYLWPLYSLSLIGPLVYTFFGFLRDRKKEWLYYFPMTMIMLYLIAYEVVRLKILGGRSLVSRQ